MKSLFTDTLASMSESEMKTASIPLKSQGIQDALSSGETGPQGVEGRHQGARLGKTLGGLAGLAGGAVLGADMIGENWDAIGAPSLTYAPIVGAAAPLLGAGIGSRVGKHVGHGIGKSVVDTKPGQSRHFTRGVDRVRDMSPHDAISQIRMLEATGSTHPDEIQGMKDAYNARRFGIRSQLAHGVTV